MKKKIVVALLAIVVISLTGCSNEKTLTCTKTNSITGYTQEITEVVKYDSKTELVNNITATYKETSDEETAELNKNIYDLVFIKYNSVDGIKAETNLVDSKTLKYTISVDKSKLSLDSFNELLNTTPNKTFLNYDFGGDIKISDYQNSYLTDFECK